MDNIMSNEYVPMPPTPATAPFRKLDVINDRIVDETANVNCLADRLARIADGLESPEPAIAQCPTESVQSMAVGSIPRLANSVSALQAAHGRLDYILNRLDEIL